MKPIKLINDSVILGDIERITDQHYMPDQVHLPYGGALICSKISGSSLVIENMEHPLEINTRAYVLSGNLLGLLHESFSREYHSPSFVMYEIQAGVVLTAKRESSAKVVRGGATTLLHPHPLN